jgi:hypothetical protein
MLQRNERAYWAEVIGLAVLAVIFFRFGLLLVAFLLPIQVSWVRRGERAGLLTSGTFLVLLALLKGVDYLRVRGVMPQGGAGLLFLDIVLPVGFLIGLYLLNTPVFRLPRLTGTRSLGTAARIGAALVVAAVIYVPAGILIHLSGVVETLIAVQTELVSSLLLAANATEAEVEQLSRFVLRVFLSGFLFGYLLLLVGSWWSGSRIVQKGRFAARDENPVSVRLASMRLPSFRLPGWMIWAMVVTLGGLVLTLRFDAGWLAYAARNLILVVMTMYAFQGLAILWFFLEKKNVSRGARIGLAAGLFFGLVLPGINLVVLLGLPGFGISEVWVNYHRFDRSGEKK